MKRIFSILFAVVLVVSFSLIPAALVGASPGPGLVGLWHLDGDANDSSGNGNDGTVYGNAGYVSGKFGDALSFDGVDDYVEVAHADSLDMTSAYTLEAWVDVTDVPSNIYRPIFFRGTTGANDIEVYVQARTNDLIVAHNRAPWGSGYPGPNFDFVGFADPPTGTLFHLCVTFDGTNVQAYYNGIAQTVTQNTIAMVAPLDTDKGWWIGKVDHNAFGTFSGGSPINLFKGTIDEVRIWNVAMTPGPVTVPLCADQNINVGTVSVWNDSANLYVKYQTTGGWEMTKTHLAVATSPAGIPQNRAGNPKVGQFQHSTSHATPVTTYTYTIPLPSGTPLYIAAHAKVVDAGNPMTMTVVSDTTNEYWDWGADTTWGTDDDGWVPAVPCYVHPSWPPKPPPSGAAWIWRVNQVNPATEYNTLPPEGYRKFQKVFDIPSSVITSGTITINADNAYELYINGSLVDAEGAMSKDGPDYQEWRTVRTTDCTGDLQAGTNTIEIRAISYFNWGSYTSNPSGLIFASDITWVQEETAWGDGCEGTRFVDRGNWATYFEYHVQ